ncbi:MULTISPECIES: hypothetical protein [unclassified Ensifer]|uniref:hypothetical protein n=1 Tax=unclassified Ensifer TaxID=2633371 RepID=UPI0009E9145B|nr:MULTISPECIES: hypothetical protein [unclassified Ensifer]
MTTSSALCVSNDRFPMPEKSLVIFLHGTGASGAQAHATGVVMAVWAAGSALRGAGRAYSHRYGHQWFSTEGNPLDPAPTLAARNALDSIIGDVVGRERSEDTHDRVAFVGVSQGAIVALDAVASGRRSPGFPVIGQYFRCTRSFANPSPNQRIRSD